MKKIKKNKNLELENYGKIGITRSNITKILQKY